MRHVVIAGATEGIGLALARAYAVAGWRVAMLGRDSGRLREAVSTVREASEGSRVAGILWDATDPRRAGAAFAEAASALGQVDLIIYVAGIRTTADDPEGRGEAAARMFDVNATGAIRLLEHAAAYMAAAGRGQIAGIGSIAGDRGRKGNPAYGASKAALHTYLEGLRHALHGSGVKVSTVKPGFVRTRMLREGAPAFPPAPKPEAAARDIMRGISKGKSEFYVPWWWRLVSLGLRLTPRFVYGRLAPP